MEKLAQEYEVMFERNIAIIASRKKEVNIISDGELYEGFLCGLDEIWIQLYGHNVSDKGDNDLSWRFVLLNKDNISSIVPTGKGLQDLEPESRVWIEKKISNFSSIADKFMKSKDQENGNNR